MAKVSLIGICNSRVRKLSQKTELWIMTSQNQVKSNGDLIANFSSIFRNLEFLVKIKFPSYLTRKCYLYLVTINFRATQLPNISFIKNSELFHRKSHLNLYAKFSANNFDLPEFLVFFLISLLIEKSVFKKTITDLIRIS